jgi:predicted nucleic acid-binding Zn ribbon protein
MTPIDSPSKAGPQMVGDLVSKVLARRGLSERIEAASVVLEWPELVGERIARVTRPLRVSGGTLLVAVSSSPWMMELDMMRPALMRRINAGRGKGRIERLVFVMDDGEGDRDGGRERHG